MNSPLDELRAAAKLRGPKMPPPQDAMANAEGLRSAPMMSNQTFQSSVAPPSPLTIDTGPSNYRPRGGPGGSTISGGTLGSDPYWGNSATSQIRRQEDTQERARGQHLAGLQQAFTESQRQDDVLQTRDDADLFGGLTGRRMAGRAGAQAGAASVLSESAAGDTFRPNAAAARERDLPEQLAQIQARYVDPARISAGATVGAAEARAQGQREAAEVGADATMSTAAMNGLQKAIAEWIATNGTIPTEDDMKSLRMAYRAPGQDVNLPAPQTGMVVPRRR